MEKRISRIFNNVKIFVPDQYEDYRGKNIELFNINNFNSYHNFPIQSISYSKKNVLRGFHGDFKTWKLVKVLKGEAYLVIVDLNKESDTFLQHQHFLLSEHNHMQILIPSGFINAHYVLTDEVIFHYDLSVQYSKEQMTIRYDDIILPKINWPFTSEPILSERDKETNLNNLITF